ncbi:DUF115 domain-containing protein [Candidatus Magnetomoraceae bacterium gMMP-1]
MNINKKISNRFYNWLDRTIDIWEREAIIRMRDKGRLLYLSELIPFFKNSKVFAFGTGGSIANLTDVSRLNDFNLIITTTGPFYCYKKYGFIPNMWTLTYPPVVDVVLEKEKKQPLDFSDTFILVPTNDSDCKIHFSTPIVKELIKRHPEATYVIYSCIHHHRQWPETIPHPAYLMEGIEPLHGLAGSLLDNIHLPICFYLGVSTVYFSGIDLIPTTGHFWDRNLEYQTMDGKPLKFPDTKLLLRCAELVHEICKKNGRKIYRLEKEETLLKAIYPYIDFDASIKDATSKITPDYVKNCL